LFALQEEKERKAAKEFELDLSGGAGEEKKEEPVVGGRLIH
jgi:hypothetical protein